MRERGKKSIALMLSSLLVLNAVFTTGVAMATETTDSLVLVIDSTEGVEAEWFVDLKYAKAIDEDGNQIIFNSAVVIIPEGEGIYSIATTISGGTMSTTVPTLDDGTVVKASMNLAKTECVYTFTDSDGVPVAVSKEVAEEIIRSVIFVRNTGEDMSIEATVDGSYTSLPDGINLTGGQDSDGLGGHFYGYVASSGITWVNAYNAARNMWYKGMQGYLVTITRKEEDNILGNISVTPAWSGGSRFRYSDGTMLGGRNDIEYADLIQASQEGFYWTAGPEGEVNEIYTNTSSGKISAIPEGVYTNWGSGEPNNSSTEECMHVYLASTKQWNDYSYKNSAVSGYFVEFGDTAVPT